MSTVVKKLFVVTGILTLLASCSKEPNRTVSMLASGSSKACIASDTQRALRSLLFPSILTPEKDFQRRNDTIRKLGLRLDNASVAEMKASEKSIVCDATLVIIFADKEGRSENAFPVKYEIRPSIEDPTNFIITGDLAETKRTIDMLADNLTPRPEAARSVDTILQSQDNAM